MQQSSREREKATFKLLSRNFRNPQECHGTIYIFFTAEKCHQKEQKRNSGKRVKNTHTAWSSIAANATWYPFTLVHWRRWPNVQRMDSTKETHSEWQYDHLKMLKLKIMSMCWLAKLMAQFFCPSVSLIYDKKRRRNKWLW